MQIIFSAAGSAQEAHPAFKHYTVEDGLPSSEVYQVKQDSKGYIWFATGNGVSRFNGYEFENFSMSDGLPDNTVFETYEDNFGRIWFVPVSCKLSYYYNGKIYPFKYNNELQKLLNNPIKSSFGVDRNGTVFLGVTKQGVYEISDKGKITQHFGANDSSIVLNVIEPDSNMVIHATNFLSDRNSIRFNTSWIKGTSVLKDSISGACGGFNVLRTKNNLTFVSWFTKLFIFKNVNEYQVKTFPKRIISSYQDRDGDIWIGTYLGGVYHFRKGEMTNSSVYLSDLPVNSILQDKEGGFWFATEGNGVFYASSKDILTYDESIGLSANKVNSLATDGTYIYAGTQNGFIHKIKDTIVSSYNINIKKDSRSNISSLFYDKLDQRLLISGTVETGWIKNERFDPTHIFGNFNKIVADSKKNYWVAGSMNLGRVVNDKPIPLSLSRTGRKRINALIEWDDDKLLLGTLNGLWEYDKPKDSLTYLGSKDSLLSHRILDLAFFSDKLLAIATKGSGLLIYDMDKRTYQINTNKGLCGDNVYRVFADGSSVWVATNMGINKLTVTNSNPLEYTICKYTTTDGIASNEINDILVANGKVWAATNKGLSVFNEGDKVVSNIKTPLYITGIMINDSSVLLNDLYELNYSQNNIKINFIGLGYKNAGKLEYRYRMSGLDTVWTYTQNREIQFTTLPPNTYRFELAVKNSNEDWNSTEVNFNIKAPFWQKWWFKALIIFVVLVLVFLFFRYRIRLIQKREEKSTALDRTFLNLKLKALRAQMNPHFTFNVMNSIQHFILNKDDEAAHRYLSKFSKLMRSILNNSEHNTISIADELKALELYLELEAMRFEKRFEYSIIIDRSINTSTIQVPSMLIQPYVENAIKHGILPLKETGKIKIEISKDSSVLKCVIEDNGIGRKKAGENKRDNEHHSMGTAITKERLSVINEINNSNLSERIIDLTDENGNAIGTRVEIYIPVNQIQLA